MSLHSELIETFDYLQSIRKLKTYLSFDVLFPTTWKLPKKYVDEKTIFESESNIANMRLISFAANFDDESVKKTLNSIKSIINYNKELEEKEVLLQLKIEELKRLFETKQLNELHNLNFETKQIVKPVTLDGAFDESTEEPAEE